MIRLGVTGLALVSALVLAAEPAPPKDQPKSEPVAIEALDRYAGK